MTPPKKPRRPWLAPSEIARAASDALPRLPLSPFPNRFTEPSPPAMSANRNAHPVPDLKPGFFQHQAALSRGAALAVANAPFEMAREVSRAKNPDEVIHGLTGVGLSMDPKSPARRPNDAHGGRFGQGVAVALSALGLGEMGAEIGTAERAYATGLRNAERFAANTKAVRPTLDALANHIDPLHVPAFERAGGRTRPFGDLLTLTPGLLNGTLPAAIRDGLANGGFTLDRAGRPFSGNGFAVAKRRLTQEINPADQNAILRFVNRPDVQAALGEPNHYVGGWRDPATGQAEINVTQMHDTKTDAIMSARREQQKMYGEFGDGAYLGDRDFIASPASLGVDNKPYTGLHHGEADAAAAEAMRATPEGMALMKANHESAVKQHGFVTGRNEFLERYDERVRALAPDAKGPAYALHSTDLSLTPGASQRPKTPLPMEPHPCAVASVNCNLRTSKAGRSIHDALLADEQAQLTRKTTPAFEAAAQTLPHTEVFGAGAIAGASKMGWYQHSARALNEVFGPDAPRFAALLAAMSPQTPVEKNLAGALDVWEVWNALGRPTDEKGIANIMNDVARANPEGSELRARVPNGIRALTSEDPTTLALSGPKVFNFHRNLIGDTNRVTLDTWMARLGDLDPQVLSRSMKLKEPGPGGSTTFSKASPTYLAYSGRMRQTADYLERATGHPWTPAEVQETLWSWGKALSETANPETRGRHPSLFSASGNLVDAIPSLTVNKIRGVPDFATLMNEAPYTESIQRQGLPLPIAASPIPPAMPEPHRGFLDILARNMQNERGALGVPNDPSIVGSIEHDPTGEIAASRKMMQQYAVPPGPPAPKRPGFMVYTRNSPREWWRLSNMEPDLHRAFRLGDYWTKSGGEFRVTATDDLPHGDTSDHFNPVREIGPAVERPITPVTPLFPDKGNAALPMLGLSGGAALGGMTLWDYLNRR